jgi:hypothetical protein
VFHFGDRRWRVRGFSKNTGPEQLRVNLHVSRPGGAFHVDTVELYSARQRAVFTKQASDELAIEERVVKRELGAVLLKLEERQEAEKKAAEGEKQRPEMTEVERHDALELLRDPKLLERLLTDFRRCGVVGEETNKLVGYLAATSRKLDEPLAVIIQSSSAAGKSSLMEAVLALMPEEERVQYSAMTGQSLFYMGESDLAHKILAIVEEEGAERASYALKLLQSEGELTIASTGKDPATGRLVTQEYRVEGPVMIFLTTTAIEVDEALLNRCIVLTVDEGREQTRAIHELQREAQTLEGLLAKHDRSRIRKLHQNAQRLLRPLAVVNPHARELRFLDHQTRTRRDATRRASRAPGRARVPPGAPWRARAELLVRAALRRPRRRRRALHRGPGGRRRARRACEYDFDFGGSERRLWCGFGGPYRAHTGGKPAPCWIAKRASTWLETLAHGGDRLRNAHQERGEAGVVRTCTS